MASQNLNTRQLRQKRYAELIQHALQTKLREQGEVAAIEFADGLLSGIAVFLNRQVGSRAAFSTFTQLADESLIPILERKA